jgi:hypothetical protein
VLTVYLIGAIVGGGLVLLSALGLGEHGHHDVGHAGHAEHDAWLPFLTVRFWTWGLGFFGITGTLLTWLTPLGGTATALAATGTGLLVGTGISAAVRGLRKAEAVAGARLDALVGRPGRITVTVRPGGEPGKVRCELGDEVLDLLAVLAEGRAEALPPGAAVLVLAIDDGRAVVIPAGELTNDARTPRGED